MADPSRGEGVGRDEITQSQGTARPPSAGSGSYRQRNAVDPPPLQQQRRPPSIRIRRLPSTPSVPRIPESGASDGGSVQGGQLSGRRRATSAPMRPTLPPELQGQGTATSHLPAVTEESSAQHHLNAPPPATDGYLAPPTAPGGRMRSGSASSRLRRMGSNMGARFAAPPAPPPTAEDEYESEIVDLLDVVDPEVSTMTTLTNVQNSLFVPDLGRFGSFLNRRPTYELTRRPTPVAEAEPPQDTAGRPTGVPVARIPTKIPEVQSPAERQERQDELSMEATRYLTVEEKEELEQPDTHTSQRFKAHRRHSLASVISETPDQYAVLPHGVSLAGWSQEDKDELNDHVRHLMHSRRAKFKRSMKGFGKYIRKPLGFFVTLYAVLITLFGLAWVLFLIGWINVGGQQSYLINIIDNVLVALFAIVGDGLAPFRAVDTYHMIYIAHYHHLTWRLRKERDLPQLENENDLPPAPPKEVDLEAAEKGKFSVLNANQQRKLIHHQTKFSKSHTFYKPHETSTHYAFPLRLLVAVVCLLDCHSLFQIALGTCTWAISYHHRPGALTAVILCCSISCNIAAGITITIGDRISRKKEVVKRMLRQALTEEAMSKMEKKRQLTHIASDEEGPHVIRNHHEIQVDDGNGVDLSRGVSEKDKEKEVETGSSTEYHDAKENIVDKSER